METGDGAAEHPLRRREDCGAALGAIVPSQEVWWEVGGGAQSERDVAREEEEERAA